MRLRLASPALALAMVAGGGLSACGAGTPQEVVVTVTGTPSGAATTTTPTSSGPPSAQAEAKPPTSDVKGRAFDFGMVTGAKRAGKLDVLVVDRWTDPRVDDAVLAVRGLPVTSWKVGSDRFVNQNDKKTFDIPVRAEATFLLNHCVADGEPLQARSVSATELAEAPDSDRLVLVTLDGSGWATGGETFAGC